MGPFDRPIPISQHALDDMQCASEDALDHAESIEEQKDVTGLDTYFMCGGCDFPHMSDQQAINCCPPRQVWVCPNESCGRLCDSEIAARECCS